MNLSMDHPFSYSLTIIIFNSHWLIPLLLVCALIPYHEAHIVRGNVTDRQALISFKAGISDDSLGVLSSWNETNTTLHLCDWFGVTCSAPQHPDRVTALHLDYFNLTGTLSPYLANLTFLRLLNLSSNNFHGRIPADLGRLSSLGYLDLRHNLLEGEIPLTLTHYCSKLHGIVLEANNLSGQIPSNFSHCLNLSIINFNGNQLVGTIPTSLGSLPWLSKLALRGNRLKGGIPVSLGNISSISYLDLSVNSLEGCIPDELSRIPNLKFLDLALNRLSSEIPPSLFNISSIQHINVGDNNLSGTLPNDMGITLANLHYFYVFYNQFEGTIPVSLSNATGLRTISLHGNRFVGLVPPNLGSLQNLESLDLGLNKIEARDATDWDFLASLSNCSNLDILHLSLNNLQGILPNSVANLSAQLRWLAMAGNSISGIIPSGIGRYNRLTVFHMTQNLLTGNIPSTIGMLQNLHELHMSGNQLQGEIPSCIGNLTQLNELFLSGNELQGSIPSSIGKLIYLDALDLSHNNLVGTIPGQALGQLSSLSQYLDLSNNFLNGSLPPQTSSLINLNVLDVSENRLFGEIPGSLGGCQILEQLFMQGNFFQGIIPSDLSVLKGIQELDLSRNNLSGPIPYFFGTFHLLNYLNLSFNDLEGRVPKGGVFGNASAISVLGNTKLCGGIQELHLRPCDGTSPRGSSLLKVIIPLIVASILVIFIYAAYYIRTRKRASSPPVPSLNEPFVQLSYAELHKATDGFSSSNLIGVGSSGSVYKGIMDSNPNRVVAIKVLNLQQRGADTSFTAECESLRVIQHRNLLNIVTVCSSIDRYGNDFKALIFDYMPNGNLDEWLHPSKKEDNASSTSLSLVQRWKIVMDVAFAVDYLHHQCHTPIVHCDLKPSNVLLDCDMSAHVGDFGLSRFLQRSSIPDQDTNCSAGIKGSIGYIPPEYGTGGVVTTKGDVYSYGVLLLETFTGRRPTDMFQGDLNIHKYVEMAYPDRVLDITDPSITVNDEGMTASHTINTTDLTGWMHECMISIFGIGLLCSKQSPNERVEMGDVIKELLHVKKLLDVAANI